MSQESNKPVLESVDGLELGVTKEVRREPLPTKEWLHAKVTALKKQIPDKQGWDPSLNWEFTLLEENFKKRKIWLNTALIATPKSKLYRYYIEILGMGEIKENEMIKPQNLIDKTCYIMVANSTQKKDKQVVADVKFDKGNENKSDVAKVVKESEANQKQTESKVDKELSLEEINLEDL